MVKVAKKNKQMRIEPRHGRFHVGLCQSGVDVSQKLQDIFPGANVAIHRFNTPEELQKQLQRSYIDLLVLSATDDLSWLSDMVRRIKFHTQLQYIPLMVYAPGADKNLVINCLSECADDITVDEWDDSVMSAKAMMLVTRAQRDMGVNPSSRLPGANAIEYDIDRRIRAGKKFAVCYADLDNFKSYNDYYGYFYGDKVIRLTAQIVRDIVFDLLFFVCEHVLWIHYIVSSFC